MYTEHPYPHGTHWQEDQVDRSNYRGTRSAVIGGNLIYPVLVAFPIVVLATDLAFWGIGDHFWARASEWLLVTGVVLGALAVDLGLIEFTTIRRVRSRVAGRSSAISRAQSPEHLDSPELE